MIVKLIITCCFGAGAIGVIWRLFHNEPVLVMLGTVGAIAICLWLSIPEYLKSRSKHDNRGR